MAMFCFGQYNEYKQEAEQFRTNCENGNGSACYELGNCTHGVDKL